MGPVDHRVALSILAPKLSLLKDQSPALAAVLGMQGLEVHRQLRHQAIWRRVPKADFSSR